MARKPVIAIIHHEADRNHGDYHLISLIRRFWKSDGIEILDVYGTQKFVPADLAILHVDLSVCPREYLKFAARYPRVVNAGAIDIRKRSYSLNLVRPEDGYQGPVIVKTSLNSAGHSEAFRQVWANQRTHRHKLLRLLRLERYLHRSKQGFGKVIRLLYPQTPPQYPYPIRGKEDYRIFESAKLVPLEFYHNTDLVIEKFLPERDEEKYCLREWYFFGDHEHHRVELDKSPIFTSGESAYHKVEPLPAMIRSMRFAIGLNYGKIDYALPGGRPVLFDINKTTGMRLPPSSDSLQIARDLAGGIYFFLKQPDRTGAIFDF